MPDFLTFIGQKEGFDQQSIFRILLGIFGFVASIVIGIAASVFIGEHLNFSGAVLSIFTGCSVILLIFATILITNRFLLSPDRDPVLNFRSDRILYRRNGKSETLTIENRDIEILNRGVNSFQIVASQGRQLKIYRYYLPTEETKGVAQKLGWGAAGVPLRYGLEFDEASRSFKLKLFGITYVGDFPFSEEIDWPTI